MGGAAAAHAYLAVLGQRVVIAWKEFDGERTQLRALRSDDGGDSWRDYELAATTGGSDQPRVLTFGADFHVFLEHARASPLADDPAAMKLFSRRSRGFALLACGLLAAGLGAAPAPELRPFNARSLVAIKQAHAGRPFMVAFWSVSCEPCREEMMIVTDLHRRYPRVPIVLIAADATARRSSVF